jgi:bifunctional non-homologous end joining protein LigD
VAETVLDGEIVALDGDGLPSFSSLQNLGDGAAAILFYAFDAPVLAGTDLGSKPLATRREILRELIPNLPDTIRFSETFDVSPSELTAQFAPMDSRASWQSAATAGCSRPPRQVLQISRA